MTEFSLQEERDHEYRALKRALQWIDGFGLFFVECTPAQADRLITQITAEIPEKKVGTLSLSEPIQDFYAATRSFTNKNNQLDILFVRGLETSFIPYIKAGYGGEGDYYKEDSVPRVLGLLNLQREHFREDFPHLSFVFLLPTFGLKYFIRRAPDFFDWRSGVFRFLTDKDLLEKVQERILAENDYDLYLQMTPTQRAAKILEIQEYLNDTQQTEERKAELCREQGRLFRADNNYLAALTSYDKALFFKPDYHRAWGNRGNALGDLGRYEEALVSYDKALSFKPDYDLAWNNRGIALVNLGRYEEALASYDKAVSFKPDYHVAWNNRGIALVKLGRYEEALASHDKALFFKPNYRRVWYDKACCYALQGKVEMALENLQQAIVLNPEWLEYAKTDKDFDLIREDERFKKCLNLND